jgi:hypothetical protein
MELLLKIKAKKQGADFGKLYEQLLQGKGVDFSDFEIFTVDGIVFTFKNEIIDYITEHGLADLIETEPILEALVARGATQTNIISLLHKYLDKVGVDNELIIVDPYFYSDDSPAYIASVELVIGKYLGAIDNLIIITLPDKIKAASISAIESALKDIKPTLAITSNTSINYHDRFWISHGREKGVITGTSLNGFGKRYALIDRLNTTDVREIVKALVADGLI